LVPRGFLRAFSGQTRSVDQTALVAFWKELGSVGTLAWNTSASLCGQGFEVQCTGENVTAL